MQLHLSYFSGLRFSMQSQLGNSGIMYFMQLQFRSFIQFRMSLLGEGTQGIQREGHWELDCLKCQSGTWWMDSVLVDFAWTILCHAKNCMHEYWAISSIMSDNIIADKKLFRDNRDFMNFTRNSLRKSVLPGDWWGSTSIENHEESFSRNYFYNNFVSDGTGTVLVLPRDNLYSRIWILVCAWNKPARTQRILSAPKLQDNQYVFVNCFKSCSALHHQNFLFHVIYLFQS